MMYARSNDTETTQMKRLVMLILTLLSLAIIVSAQDAIPTPDPARYADLRPIINARGFPQIGFPSAPVSVVIYGAFDDPASGEFFRDGYPTLIERVRTGEIVLVYVPMAGRGAIPTGRGAARAAICAGEQGAFWEFHDQLYTWQATDGDEAYAGSRLIDGAARLPISRSAWDECMLSDRPDAVLLEGEATAASVLTFTTTPFVTVNDVPSALDRDSLIGAIQFESARNVATFEAALDATPEATAEGTPDPESTEPVVVTLEPLLGEAVTPPLIIGLPPDWVYGYDTLLLQDVDAIRNMPIAVYTGPVTGGTGTLVLIWGFPNLIPSLNDAGIAEPNLWADGLRLLRLAVIEQECNIGTDLRRDFSIGGLAAVGTTFAAVDCPELADTRGWFAGVQQFGLNFVFYAFAEPISAMDGSAPDELQRILDTVRFVAPPTATPPPTPAP
jgi:protein-disulfide isomerase